MRHRVLFLALVLALGACAKQSPSGAASSPSPSPSQTGATQNEWTLRYELLDHYPNFAFCDPDFYPVARVGGEQANADDWWTRNRTTPEARAIRARHGYADLLDASKRLVAYRDHKKLTVIQITRMGGGYQYTLSLSTNGSGRPDQTVTGTISDGGTIVERSRTARMGGCPICLEGVTRIATPGGAVEVSSIRPGDVVYSIDASGRRVAVRVARIVRRATAGPHLMERLAFADGRVLIAAGAHPASDGRLLRDLHTGAAYDGSTIASIGYINSWSPATYDILPASATGDYWANGILVGSTLR